MHFQTSIIIDQPVDAVFGYVCNSGLMAEWVQGFKTFRQTKGRRRSAGSRGVQVFKEPDGEITEVEEEVLAREKNKLLELLLHHPNMKSKVRYRFLDLGEGVTKLQVDVRTKLRPFLFNFLSPFVKGPMLRRQQADLLRLKQVLE